MPPFLRILSWVIFSFYPSINDLRQNILHPIVYVYTYDTTKILDVQILVIHHYSELATLLNGGIIAL